MSVRVSGGEEAAHGAGKTRKRGLKLFICLTLRNFTSWTKRGTGGGGEVWARKIGQVFNGGKI